MDKQIHLEPTPKQHLGYEKLFDNITNYLLFGGGAGGGKSWLGCEWLLTMCYRYPGTKWFIGRKELTRLMASSYITWQKVCKYHGVPAEDWKLNGKYNYIQFTNGSRIDLLDCSEKPSDPDFERFGSTEYTGGWLEEAGEIVFGCFDVLKARIGRFMNKEYGLIPKLLITCNPTQNWIYRVFYLPWKKKELEVEYFFIRSLFGDNPHTADSYGKQLGSITDPNQRARLRDGVWEYTLDDLVLISYEAILDLFINTIEQDKGRKYLIADVARYGGDRIVYNAWLDWDLYLVSSTEKQSTVTTEADIKDLTVSQGIPYARTVIDEDGVGGGIVDHLAGVLGFQGGRSAISDPADKIQIDEKTNLRVKVNYKNLRSQCYFMLADKINKHQIKISAKIPEKDREMLIADLQQVRRLDVGADAPLQVVSKDEMKDALGRSPDFGDTLMMRIYPELIVDTININAYNPPDPKFLAERGVADLYGGLGWDS